MDSHEYGQQPSVPGPSGLPVPPPAEAAPPAPAWAQPAARGEPSGLPAQGWVPPPAAAEPHAFPPATDPAAGPTLSAFAAYGSSPTYDPAAASYGQPPTLGQIPQAPAAAPYGEPTATGHIGAAPAAAHGQPAALSQNTQALNPPAAAPYGQPAVTGQIGAAPAAAYRQQPVFGQNTQAFDPPAAPFGQPPAGLPFAQLPMGGSETPPYLVLPTAPTAPVRGGGRSGRVIAGIAAAALLLIGGAAAVGADAWAKGSVCDAVEQLGKGGGGSAGGPTSSDLDEAEAALKTRARLLFFHGELRDATHGLADDIAAIRQIQKTVGADDPGESELTQMVLIAASVDSHARKAQRACGLPEQSLLDD